MLNPALLDEFRASWEPNAAVAQWLFHGTIEPFESAALRPAEFDGVVWAAREPGIAQAYIPSSPGCEGFHADRHRFADRLKPSLDRAGRPENWYKFALQMGYPTSPDIERDAQGRTRSWSIPAGWPSYGDLVSKMTEIGYLPDPNGDYSHFVKYSGGIYKPADWKAEGRLFLLRVPPDLRFFNMSCGEFDPTDKQYYRHAEFRQAEADGYDGVIIDDAAQVDGHGNVDHISYGLFPKTIARLEWIDIPATHFAPAPGQGYWHTDDLPIAPAISAPAP